MEFIDKFEEASYKERVFFTNLCKMYGLFPEERWHLDATPFYEKDKYDYLAFRLNTRKRLVIEIKIRETWYSEGYVYETKKHNALMKIKALDPENITILYVNSTPKGTYIWNIDKIIDNYKPIMKEMNIATMDSRNKKRRKKVYLLQPEDAEKHYAFHWDDKQLTQHFKEKLQREKKVNNTLKQVGYTTRCIFSGWDLDEIMNKNNNETNE